MLEEHDTPESSVCATAAAGVGWTVQVTPSHSSTRALPGFESPQPPPENPPADRDTVLPTATQKLGEAHETADRAGLDPAEPGPVAPVQAVPSQLSENASMLVGRPPSAGLLSAPPTAMQKLTAVHDTPVRADSTRPSGGEVG